MSALIISLSCKPNGDTMGAIIEARTICAAGKYEWLELSFHNGVTISIKPTSEILDLYKIYDLETKLLNQKKQ